LAKGVISEGASHRHAPEVDGFVGPSLVGGEFLEEFLRELGFEGARSEVAVVDRAVTVGGEVGDDTAEANCAESFGDGEEVFFSAMATVKKDDGGLRVAEAVLAGWGNSFF